MDQPTNLEIVIKGTKEDVKRAALAAQRRIDLDTKGFEESNYVFGDGSDFETKLADTIGIFGDYKYNENEDGTAEYTTVQESYGCVEEDDIVEIVKDISTASLNVEVHISAVITDTYEEDYELCVNIDYVEGEMSVDSSEEYFDDFDEEDDE